MRYYHDIINFHQTEEEVKEVEDTGAGSPLEEVEKVLKCFAGTQLTFAGRRFCVLQLPGHRSDVPERADRFDLKWCMTADEMVKCGLSTPERALLDFLWRAWAWRVLSFLVVRWAGMSGAGARQCKQRAWL